MAQGNSGAEDTATNSGSRDQSSLSRAGPCAGFEGLKIVVDVRAASSGFRSCGSKDDIKDLNDELGVHKKLLQTLMGSCRKALGELKGAKQRAENAAEAAKKKQVKADAAAKKEAKGGGKNGGKAAHAKRVASATDHPIFQLPSGDVPKIPASASWETSWLLDKPRPFLITNVQAISSSPEVETVLDKAFKDFAKVFNKSALKAWSPKVEIVSACTVHFFAYLLLGVSFQKPSAEGDGGPCIASSGRRRLLGRSEEVVLPSAWRDRW